MKNLIKKILRESEEDDLDWIRDSKPDLLNKYVYFEPMITLHEFEKVLERLKEYNKSFNFNIGWWHSGDIDNYFPEDEALIHHILINDMGGMVYGGISDYDYAVMQDDGATVEEIKTDYSDNRRSAEIFIENNFGFPGSVSMLNGREFFNL